MKKFSIEQKARAYDEAIKKAKDCLKDGTITSTAVDYISTIFPELKEDENEDERIRKYLISFVELNRGFNLPPEDAEQIIAWLEKQGNNSTSIDIDEMVMKYSQTKDGNFGLPVNCMIRAYRQGINDALNLSSGIEKQGEQKPTDKVEPKFKVGDWIVHNKANFVFKVVSVGYNSYEVVNTENYKNTISFDNDVKYHLWTIKDAKDADVVVDKSDGTIGIYQSIGHHPDGGSYNDPSYCFLYCRYDDGFFYAGFEHGNMIDSDDLIPATKEQCVTLMEAMHDEGYEWDAEKKVLKKIKQKSDKVEPKFNIGDTIIDKDLDEYGYGIIKDIKDGQYIFTDGSGINIDEQEGWQVIKTPTNIEQKSAWSEEDEVKRNALIGLVKEIKNQPLKRLEDWDGYISWLKTLKDRIQPKQEWSEDDDAKRIDYLVNLPKDNWEYIHEFVEKFGRVPKDEDELNALVEYVFTRHKPSNWSEEDEEMIECLRNCLDELEKEQGWLYIYINNKDVKLNKVRNWLKLLKDKVQPQAELTPLDKNILEAAIAFVEQNDHFNYWRGVDKRTVLSALYSLRPQEYWKPIKGRWNNSEILP